MFFLEGQRVVGEILQQIIFSKVIPNLFPKNLLFKSCLNDSIAVRDSLFSIAIPNFLQQPKRIKEYQENRPQSVAFKVRKSFRQAREIDISQRSKSQLETKTQQKFNTSNIVYNKKLTQKNSAPIRLINQKERHTIKHRLRDCSILNENVNISEVFKFQSENIDEKNDTIQRILRERKKKQTPFVQKSIQNLFKKKLQTKRLKQQAKNVLSINTTYDGIPILLCKKLLTHVSPELIDINYNIFEQQDEKKSKKKIPQRKTSLSEAVQKNFLKQNDYPKLKIIDQKQFSFKKIGKNFCQNLKIKNKEVSFQNENVFQQNNIAFKDKARFLPKKVSFETLSKIKNSEKMVKIEKQPKKKKTIIFNTQQKQKSLIGSYKKYASFSQQLNEITGNASQNKKSEKEIIHLGSQSAVSTLFNNKETIKKIKFVDVKNQEDMV